MYILYLVEMRSYCYVLVSKHLGCSQKMTFWKECIIIHGTQFFVLKCNSTESMQYVKKSKSEHVYQRCDEYLGRK